MRLPVSTVDAARCGRDTPSVKKNPDTIKDPGVIDTFLARIGVEFAGFSQACAALKGEQRRARLQTQHAVE